MEFLKNVFQGRALTFDAFSKICAQKKIQLADAAQVEQLQKEVKDWKEKYQRDLAAVKKEAAIEAAILKARGRNVRAIKALLDLENVRLREDGVLEGLDLDGLKNTDGYLFDFEQTVQKGNGAKGGEYLDGLELFAQSARNAAGLKL